ncbi:hypothetical protein BJX64DRAFT_291846 [Aspergillus heterothallicus]
MPRPIHLAKGKLIHVDGNPGHGFVHQFVCKFDLDALPGPYQILPLGLVEAHLNDDTDTTDRNIPTARPVPGQEHFPFTQDTTPRDALETLATQVPPPERSENPFDPAAPNWQDWLGDYVRRLVDEGHLGREAIAVFENAPRVLDDKREDAL